MCYTQHECKAPGINLEGHVFQEVGNSVVLGGFVAASSIDPQTHGCRGNAGVLGGYAKAVFQCGDLDLGSAQCFVIGGRLTRQRALAHILVSVRCGRG